MITITVHHHHQAASVCGGHSTMTTSDAAEATNGSSGEQENKLSKSTCDAKSGSSVQVQYSASRRHFRESSGKLNIGLEIDRLQTAKKKTAELSNNLESTNQNQVNSSKQVATNLMAQTGASGTTNIDSERASINRLHSRSVSLIVSPEFSSESSTESNGGCGFEATNMGRLYRRRSVSRAPRRARLLLAGSQPALHRKQADEREPLISGCSISRQQLDGKADLVSPNKQLDPSAIHQLVSSNCSTSSTQIKDCSGDQATSSSSEERTVSNNMEQFRQAGIFLREISDEFFRSRRRTI